MRLSVRRKSRKGGSRGSGNVSAKAVPSTPDRRPIASNSSPRGVADVGGILGNWQEGCCKAKDTGSVRDPARARGSSFSESSASDDAESCCSSERSSVGRNGDGDLDDATIDRDDFSAGGALSEESRGGESREIRTMNKLVYRLRGDDVSLTEIVLDCDSIERRTAKDIAGLLPTNARIRRLCLVFGVSGNNEGQGEAQQHRRQRHHHVRNDDNFRLILSGLAKNSSIVDVELRNAYLTRDVAARMGTALAQNRSSVKLTLRDCEFVGSGLAVLFLGLQHNKGSIRDLAIVSCDLAVASAAGVGESISDVVAASLPLLKLRSLALVDTNLTVDGLRFLCENVARSPDLVELDLSRNELGTDGTIPLCDSLRSSWRHQVTKLVLSSCSLDDYCIGELAKSLAKCPKLAILHLSHNDFGDRGASHLCKLLERNNSITEMRLHGLSDIGRRFRGVISDGLRYNNSILKSLGFSASTSLAILDTVDSIERIRTSVTGEASAQDRY